MILSIILCKKYCKFKTGNVKLPIETGRWLNIPKDSIICKLLDCNKIGDEFHYLFKCVKFKCNMFTKIFKTNSNVVKFETLFIVTKKNHLINICKLLDIMFERVSSLG